MRSCPPRRPSPSPLASSRRSRRSGAAGRRGQGCVGCRRSHRWQRPRQCRATCPAAPQWKQWRAGSENCRTSTEWKPSTAWFAAMTEATSAGSPVILTERDGTHCPAWEPRESRRWRRSAPVRRAASAVGDRPRRAALSRLNVARTAEVSIESGTGDRTKLSRRISGGREFVGPPLDGRRVCRSGVDDQVPWSPIFSAVRARTWSLKGAQICAQ